MRHFEAVIFDMDGLLLDTETIALSAFLETCEHFGLSPLRHVFERCIGTNGALGREVLREGLAGQVDHLAFVELWNGKYTACTSNCALPLKAGAAELLEHIAALDIPTAVATSRPWLKATRAAT